MAPPVQTRVDSPTTPEELRPKAVLAAPPAPTSEEWAFAGRNAHKSSTWGSQATIDSLKPNAWHVSSDHQRIGRENKP